MDLRALLNNKIDEHRKKYDRYSSVDNFIMANIEAAKVNILEEVLEEACGGSDVVDTYSKLNLAGVSNRRELLFAYEKSFDSENVSDADIYETIDTFLANNCC